jgi:hypothetical protein
MASINLASSLGVANGEAFTPLPTGLFSQPCAAYQLIMWDDGAFEAKLQISPNDGDDWIDYTDADLTASGMIDAVFIGEGIKVRLVNAAGTVSAKLVPLP